jgi:GR25 family glycosyltransferase involved in LPS biosynthesis
MLKIFIAHYSKLVERKAHMIEQFKKQNITNYEFVEKYDKEDITEKDLSIYTYNPSIRMSVVSLSLKKLYIYQQIRDYHDYALILEDDAILCDNFMDKLNKYMTELPKTYDMLFLGSGLGFHIQPELILPNKHIYRKCLYPTPWGGDGCTRCADCYLMTKECAKKVCWYMYEKKAKPRPHVDFLLNNAARDMNFEVYWSEPTLAEQGSITGLFNTSVITSNKKDWVLVFICNETSVNKTFQSIVSLRRSGEWKEDIVLMVNNILFNHGEVNEFAKLLHVILRKIPEMDDKFTHYKGDTFKYNKFHVFDTFFKRWDYVLYVETHSEILKDLSIVKDYEPKNYLYSHSDEYSGKRKSLLEQFDFNMISSVEKFQMLYKYNMLSDSFQTDMFMYDTGIIESNTVHELFELAEKYPNSINTDQGIMNLYFTCEKNLWKKIPPSIAKLHLSL